MACSNERLFSSTNWPVAMVQEDAERTSDLGGETEALLVLGVGENDKLGHC